MSGNQQPFTDKKGSLRILLVGDERRVGPGLLLLRRRRRPALFPRPEMQLSDGEDAGEHGLHGAVVQVGGGEPQRAVGDAAALGVKVEEVGALLHRLRA